MLAFNIWTIPLGIVIIVGACAGIVGVLYSLLWLANYFRKHDKLMYWLLSIALACFLLGLGLSFSSNIMHDETADTVSFVTILVGAGSGVGMFGIFVLGGLLDLMEGD